MDIQKPKHKQDKTSVISGFRRDADEVLFWDMTQRRKVILYRRFGTM
jgi:hypothetical protein